MTARSLTIIVPVSWAQQINDFLEGLGYGPDNLSVPLRTGASYATHVGCHWWLNDGDLATIRQGIIDAGFSAAQADAAMRYVEEGSGEIGRGNFNAKKAADGLEEQTLNEDLTGGFVDPPVMTGDIVRNASKDWRSLIDANPYEPGVFKWEEVI